MKRLVLLFLLPSPAFAYWDTGIKYNFETPCVDSATNICIDTVTELDAVGTRYTGFNSSLNTPADCGIGYNLPESITFDSESLLITTTTGTGDNAYWTDEDDENCRFNRETYAYTTGRFKLNAKYKYAKVDVLAKVPSGNGLLAAPAWAVGSDSNYAEVDGAEVLGKTPTKLYGSLHFTSVTTSPRNLRQVHRIKDDLSSDYHTYTVSLNGEQACAEFDGQAYNCISRKKICNLKETGAAETVNCGTTLPFDQVFSFIFNLDAYNSATSWAGTLGEGVLPAVMRIKSITVTRLDPDVKNAGFPVNASTGDYLQ